MAKQTVMTVTSAQSSPLLQKKMKKCLNSHYVCDILIGLCGWPA
jgi:hypothetical protein